MKKRAKTKTAKEIEHYNAILYEDLHSKMDLVIEGMQSTKHELKDDMKQLEDRLTKRMKLIESAVKHNSKKLSEHDKRFDGLELRMDRMDSRMDGMDSRMNSMKTYLSDKIDKVGVRLNNHEGRIIVLENIHH